MPTMTFKLKQGINQCSHCCHIIPSMSAKQHKQQSLLQYHKGFTQGQCLSQQSNQESLVLHREVFLRQAMKPQHDELEV